MFSFLRNFYRDESPEVLTDKIRTMDISSFLCNCLMFSQMTDHDREAYFPQCAAKLQEGIDIVLEGVPMPDENPEEGEGWREYER